MTAQPTGSRLRELGGDGATVISVNTETWESMDDDRLTALRDWVDEVSGYFAEHYGTPPIRGRVMGWLIVCDPREQTAAQIADAIRASRASLSGSLQILTASGLVKTSRRPGTGRTTYYRIADDAWAAMLRRRFQALTSFLELTERGLGLFPPDSPSRYRVLAAHDLFSWLETEIEPLWQRWDRQAERAAPPPEASGATHGP